MAFWWVNQAQSYERDRAGGYMWAPLRDSGGHTLGHREAMNLIRPGDTVFHYAKGAIRAVSTATSAAEVTPEPAGEMADGTRIGRLVRVDMTHLARPIRLSTLPLDERLAQPAGPFNVKGGIKRAYLSPITDALGSMVLERCDAALGRARTSLQPAADASQPTSPPGAPGLPLWSAAAPAVPRFASPPETPPETHRPISATAAVTSEPAVRDWLERYAVKVSVNAAEADGVRAKLRLERRRPAANDTSGGSVLLPRGGRASHSPATDAVRHHRAGRPDPGQTRIADGRCRCPPVQRGRRRPSRRFGQSRAAATASTAGDEPMAAGDRLAPRVARAVVEDRGPENDVSRAGPSRAQPRVRGRAAL